MSKCFVFFPSQHRILSFAATVFAMSFCGLAVAGPAPLPRSHGNTIKANSQSVSPKAKVAETRPPTHTALSENYGRLPVSFEPNRGQGDPEVQFLSRNHGYTLLLTPAGAVLRLVKPQARAARETKTADLKLQLVGANPVLQATGINKLPGESGYLIGNEPSSWQVSVPNFAGVRYSNIYPGVDLVYYGNQGELEYDFVIAPGADPNSIALKVGGTSRIQLDSLGNLLLETDGGEVALQKPVIYQGVNAARREVSGHYRLLGNDRIGFAVENYDPRLPLVIDPVLSYAAYLGRTVNDTVKGIALGLDGSAYLAGLAAPTSGSSQSDAFIAHISADGSTLLYMVYFGGSGASDARGIAVDAAGNAYIAGETQAPDFPVRNPLQTACSLNAARQCAGDAFVAKLNPDGSLAFSTFLGGSGEDGANAIAVDATGSIYVAGATDSTDFPVYHAGQASTGGQGDAFVAKITADGSRVLFATYLGGTGADEARGIAVDTLSGIYVTGVTHSFDFPTAKPLQANCALNAKKQCAGEAFITKIAPDGLSFIYSTYLGGSGGDSGNAIAVDASGGTYVTGETLSADFPVAKPAQAAPRGGSEAFVAKLAADGSSLVYSTYLGGSGDDYGNGITVDAAGNAFVVGRTRSADFPLKDAVQPFCKKDANGACTEDAFVAVLDPAGATLEFATYLGGSGTDEGRGIAVDAQGAVYLAGATTSADFPLAKPAQLSNSGNSTASAAMAGVSINAASGGAFVAKITGLSVASSSPGTKAKPRANANVACTGTTWLGGAGNWSNAAKWSTGIVPNSTSVTVCIDGGNAVASQVTLDINVSVGTLVIDSDDSLIISNNTLFVVAGNISNSGAIQINATTNNTFLQIFGGVSLSGGGTVTLSNNGGNGTAFINQATGGSTLTNVDNTIQGAGQIGNNSLALVNQGTINANAAGAVLSLAGVNGVTNTGLLEATAGGILQLSATTFVNAGANISANGGSAVQLVNAAVVQGGMLSAAAGGALGPPSGHTATLDGSAHGALTIAGTLTIPNNAIAVLVGSIVNTGAIQINATTSNAFLRINGAVSLSGGGTVVLSNNGGNGGAFINQAIGGSTLTNVDNTIQGAGQIGNNGLALVNNKTIDANVMGMVLSLAGLSGATNTGLLEATGGGILQPSATTFINAGANILASGGGSTVQFINGAIIQGGTLNTTAGGVLGPAIGNTVRLDGSTASGAVTNAGTLTIPNNSIAIVVGSIVNTGAIQINATTSNAFLQIFGPVSLTGAGTVTLSNNGGNGGAFINQATGGSTLTNVDNIIQGAGQIGNNSLALINKKTINANVAGEVLSLAGDNGVTNTGLLEATGGGILQLSATTFINAGASISANGSGSAVQFISNSVIQGGTLSTTSGGVLGPASGNTARLDGAAQGALTIAGTLTIPNNAIAILVGSIVNTGAIQINATTNNTFLQIFGPVSLSGAGTVALSNNGGNGGAFINQATGGSTLTNADNMIQGAGQIGNNGLVVINQAAGIFNANAGGALLLNPATITNVGLLEATNGGTLQLSNGTVNNNTGTIKVDGATSAVQFISGAVIQGGTLTTANNGVLGVASGNSITLDGATHGALAITGTYVGPNNSTTALIGSIVNTGGIQVNATSSNTFLQIFGGVSLSGGGTVVLSNNGGNGTAFINQATGGSTLTLIGNTIQGTGQIGNNGLTLVNQGTINANVAGKGLVINPAGLTNQGMLEATSGGTLQLSNAAINNSAGTISVDATSAVQFVNGAVIQGGTLATAVGGVLGVAGGNSITLDGTTHGALALTGTYVGPNNSTTVLIGSIVNTGGIQVNATSSNTFLQINGAVTLSGSGTVVLSNNGGNGTAFINQATGGSTLTLTGNTIQGTGQIGNNGLTLVNQGTINANVAGKGLVINPAGLTNQGMLEATSGGTLQLSNAAINNSAGTIKVDGAASAVQFVNGAVIQGGTLATANSGVLGVAAGNSITLDGTTHGALAIAGTYMGPNNSTTALVGSITNTGAIQINATSSNTFLQINGAVALSGGGTVVLSNNGGNGTAFINQATGGSTLTLVGNTIQGTGQIGNNGLTLVNQGTINANAASPLVINPAGTTNAGLLEATGGGTLQLSNAAINNSAGTIKVDGAASAVQFVNGAVIQGGTLATANSGVLGVAAGNSITLDGTTHGALAITGTYAGPNNSTTVLVGSITNTGAIQINATSSNTFLQINGAVNLSGGGTVTLSTTGQGGTAFINQATGGSTLTNAGNTIQGTGQIGNNGLTLVNQGTINANAASPLVINPAGITNAGLLEAASGSTLQLTNAAITNTGGTIRVDGTLSAANPLSVSGGTLLGAGAISGSVTTTGITQAGDAPLPGILTINGNGAGNFTQAAAGAFNALIGGTTAGTQFSQLNLTGTANLNGVLNVSLINGFMPAVGNQFTILMAGSVTGQFAVTNLPALPPNLVWTVTYGANTVVLSVAALSSIAVTPANPTVQPGNNLQFHATGTFTDGSMHDLSAVVTWGSSNMTVATISASGLASALQPGMTMISATLGNVNGSTTLTVPGAAMLTQVVPNTGQQGQQNLSVAITGQSTHFVQGTTTASFGMGITVVSLTVNSATSATAVLNIDPAATVGSRTVTLTTNAEVAMLANGFTVTVQNFSLMVMEAGTGSGTVTSMPAGINCPAVACSANFPSGTMVTLTATASANSTFVSWSACAGTGTCTVTMNSNQNVTATFNATNFTLTVTEAGSGGGTVTSMPAGINCPAVSCSANFPSGTMVTLTATASANSTFVSWSACAGTGTCTVTMNSNQNVTATFNATNFTLTVAEAGSGGGTVTSMPAGINCPAVACSANFPSGTMVTLTATADANSTFISWSTCAGTGTCTVTMNSNQAVTATFTLNGTVNFTLSTGPGGGTSVTVSPGDTAVFLFTLSSVGSFKGKVTLACSSPTATITCTIVPNTVTLGPGATTTMISVNTACSWLGPRPLFGPPGGPGPWLPPLALLMALAMIVAVTGTRRRKLRLVSPLAALALFAMSVAGCASVPHSQFGTTPPGTYNLVITASAPGSAPQSITVTLKVL